ncbi:ferredoxin family protein [Nguyenibacter vanlangensis]|uniref:Ferredoxin family protein n=1 Tax=Nguyenibacter vanlangensis TaxID=1216886 RepID=A0ABZ3D919_9PROT
MITYIFPERCIACNDCVAACPTHVLDPGAGGVPTIARPDQCQTCFMCELYCPADAIYVAPGRDEAEAPDPAAILASGQLGRVRRDHGWTGDDPDPLSEFWRLGPLLMAGAEIAATRHARMRGEEGHGRD